MKYSRERGGWLTDERDVFDINAERVPPFFL